MSPPPASPAPGSGSDVYGKEAPAEPGADVPLTAPSSHAGALPRPDPDASAESPRASRALLVDDREQPRILAAAELRRILPHIKLEVASSQAEALRLLDRFAPALEGAASPGTHRDRNEADQNEPSSRKRPGARVAKPFQFAVVRNGMAWSDDMELPHAFHDRLPDVPLIITCDPELDEAPVDVRDPAVALQIVRQKGLEDAIPIAGDNVAAIAAAAEACLKLDRVVAERDRAIAERDRKSTELQASKEKVNSLLRASAKLAEAEAGERRRLALVLHEDMLQLLVAARMFLACAQSSEDDAEGGPLAEIDALLVRSVQLCKDLTGLWSPLVLYEAGLVAALRWLGETTRPMPAPPPGAEPDDSASAPAGPIPGSLVAEVDCDDDAEPATQDGRTLLYQAAVELLTNVARHAGVNHARLSLRRVRTGPDSSDMLSLTVSDEGRGFDPAPAPPTPDAPHAGAAPDRGATDRGAPASPGAGRSREAAPDPGADAEPGADADAGAALSADVAVSDAVASGSNYPATDRFGLFSLAERLRLAGGRMEIESVAGRGTTVRLLFPADAGRFAQRPLFADPDPPPVDAPAAKASPSPADADGISHDPASQNEMLAPAPLSETNPATGSEPSARPPVRVLLADDHRIIRMSLSGLLGRAAGVEVVGEAVDGEEALRKAEELRPDVVLMDVNMPNLDGVEATRRLKAAQPETRVIALSMHESDDREMEMFEAGAECYVVKDGPPDQLLRAVLGEAPL